jgi:hypothetical protein
MVKFFKAALVLVLGLLAISQGALAACTSSTITLLDGVGTPGTARVFCRGTDGSGNWTFQHQIIDSTGALFGTAGNPFGVNIQNTPAVTQSGIWSTRLQDGVGSAITSDARGTERPLSVQILDASGNQITAFGGAGGTASNFSSVFPSTGTAIGGEYLTSPPTLTTGNMWPFQLDVNGNLKVNVAVGGAGGTSSNFSAAFPSVGTGIGGEYLTSPPTLTTGNMWPFQLDVNGNLKVNIIAGAAAGGTSSNFSAAFPGAGTAIGGEYLTTPPTLTSGNMAAVQVDQNGRIIISPSTVTVAQASGTSGQGGSLAMGAVTTSAPTYITAQTDPLSLDVNGNLRITGAVTQSGSWSVAQSGNWSTRTQDGSGNALSSTSGALNVNISSSGVVQSVTGSGTFTTSDTHFPATQALGDGMSNPTVTGIGSFLAGWDSTNAVWRRAQVNAGTGQLEVFVSGGVSLGGTSSSFGSVFPASGTAVGFKNGAGNMDYALVDSSHNQNISCGGNPCNATDNATFASGTTGFSDTGGFFQTTATNNACTAGNNCSAQITAFRAFHVNQRDSTGAELSDTTNHAMLAEAFTGTATAGTLAKIFPEVCQLYALVASIGTATNTQLVGLTSGQSIRICDVEVSASAADNWFLESATAASCGGTVAQIAMTRYFVANQTEKSMKTIYNGLNAGSGNALCVNTSTTGPISIGVYYDKS